MAGHATDHAYAQRLTAVASAGHVASYLETRGQGLRLGLERYGFRNTADASWLPAGSDGLVAAKAKRRADLDCMTTAVYYEARGESLRGQAAVAQVILNRVKHPAFPKTVCGVVYQGAGHRGCQFSFACDGSMRANRETLAWSRARDVASRALAGAIRGDVGAATHFHTTAVAPMWAPQMLRVASVGTHVFYKFSPYRLRIAPTAPAQPEIAHVVLTSGPAGHPPELKIAPAVEKAIEASLTPASVSAPSADAKGKPAVAAQPALPAAPVAEEARLAPQQSTAAAS